MAEEQEFQTSQAQNTPSINDLERQIEEDRQVQDKGDDSTEASDKAEEVEEEKVETEEVKKEEPKDEPAEEDRDKEIARLAYDRREARKQLKAAQEEIARLKGEKPPEQPNEEYQKQIKLEAEKLYSDRIFNDKCNIVRITGDKEYNDFGKILSAFNEVTDGGIVRPVIEAALETDNPAKVVYHLGKNLHEYERLLTLPPVQMAAAVVKLANKLNAPPPPKPQSKAPAPIKPIVGSNKAEVNEEQMSSKEWFKMDQKRLQERRFR